MIISIETSTSDLSLTLLNTESILSHISIPVKNQLSEIIVQTIKMFLKDNLISFDDISFSQLVAVQEVLQEFVLSFQLL